MAERNETCAGAPPGRPDPKAGDARPPWRRRLLAATAGLLGTAACAGDAGQFSSPAAGAARSGAPPADAVSFALIGDIPYRASELAALPALFDDISGNAQFAIHVGDIKSGLEPCSDRLLESRLEALSQIRIPLVYTPGDNEWTDCWRGAAGDHDPMERLAWLRKRVFDRPVPLLGRQTDRAPLRNLQRQIDVDQGLPENLCWQSPGVVFATLNVPGSENGRRSPLEESDHREREEANRRWLAHASRTASESGATCLVLAIHANPDLGRGLVVTRPLGEDSYAGLRRDLVQVLERFPGQVLLLHGDTHRHRVNRIAPRLVRVESFGSPFNSAWVRITVLPREAQPFVVQARYV